MSTNMSVPLLRENLFFRDQLFYSNHFHLQVSFYKALTLINFRAAATTEVTGL